LGPHRGRKSLEKVLAEAVERRLDPHARGLKAEWGQSEPLFECQHGRVEGHLLVRSVPGFPVDKHDFRKFPEIAEGRAFGKGLAENEGEASVDFVEPSHDRTELADPLKGEI